LVTCQSLPYCRASGLPCGASRLGSRLHHELLLCGLLLCFLALVAEICHSIG
jgi:hypothetical protein